MLALIRALRTELLKLKRTLALWIIFIVPFTIIVLQLFILLRFAPERDQISGWDILINNSLAFWALLTFTPFVTLETALLAGLEHGQKTWKHLFALPIPRWTIYAAKFLVALLLTGLSIVVLFAGAMLTGLIIQSFPIQSDKIIWSMDFSPYTLVQAGFQLFLTSWLVVAIHTYVSLRWPSFTVTLGFGVVMTVVSFVLANSPTLRSIFPWTLPLTVPDTGGVAAHIGTSTPTLSLLLGSIGGVIVAIIGGWAVLRRDVL